MIRRLCTITTKKIYLLSTFSVCGISQLPKVSLGRMFDALEKDESKKKDVISLVKREPNSFQ